MNTRLQVEHPVTELITGLDLVELMLRVAAGEKLPLTQADVSIQGWALEARVYAEDPVRDFMPSTGRLVRYRPPLESTTVRVDTGVTEGSEVGMHYDPMMAKLVTHGADRAAAIATMRQALDRFMVRGLQTNIPFFRRWWRIRALSRAACPPISLPTSTPRDSTRPNRCRWSSSGWLRSLAWCTNAGGCVRRWCSGRFRTRCCAAYV